MNKKIDSIQLLRAISVVLVMYNHSLLFCKDYNLGNSSQYTFFYLRHWTAIGLDLFFIISGLIMSIVSQSYVSKPNGWLTFLLKRLVRILPLYWLLTLAFVIEKQLLHHPVTSGELYKTLLFFPIGAAKEVIFPVIGQGWSLSYELYFYLLIVVFLFFKTKQIYRNMIILLINAGIVGYFTLPADAAGVCIRRKYWRCLPLC